MIKWIVAVLLLLFVYHVREVFPPFIVGAIFAYLLHPAIKFAHERLNMRPLVAAAVIYITTSLLIVWGAWIGIPRLQHEASKLYEHRRETVVGFLSQVNSIPGINMGDVEANADLILASAQDAAGKPEQLMHVGGVISESVLSLLVCIITSIYMLIDSRRVGRFFMRFIPSERRATVVSLISQMDVIFRRYVLGQLFLVALMSTIGFVILEVAHVKYALLLAIMSGCFELIPVLGPAIVYLVIIALTFSQLGPITALGVFIAFFIVRQVEDYFIVPNTVGHAVELHPLATVFAVLVGERMAGALGMLIAIPVAAAIKVIIDFCYPAVQVEIHHKQKNPLDALLAWLGVKPRQPESDMNPQAKADLEAIEYMHEGSAGTRGAEARQQKVEPSRVRSRAEEDADSTKSGASAGSYESSTPGDSKPAQATTYGQMCAAQPEPSGASASTSDRKSNAGETATASQGTVSPKAANAQPQKAAASSKSEFAKSAAPTAKPDSADESKPANNSKQAEAADSSSKVAATQGSSASPAGTADASSKDVVGSRADVPSPSASPAGTADASSKDVVGSRADVPSPSAKPAGTADASSKDAGSHSDAASQAATKPAEIPVSGTKSSESGADGLSSKGTAGAKSGGAKPGEATGAKSEKAATTRNSGADAKAPKESAATATPAVSTGQKNARDDEQRDPVDTIPPDVSHQGRLAGGEPAAKRAAEEPSAGNKSRSKDEGK